MSGFFAAVFSLGFVAQVLRISIPYVLGALGATLTERSGIVDLAVEAKLLFGGLAAALVAYSTGSIALGIVAGAAAGATVGLVQAACAIGLRADHVVVGVALNIIALAGPRYLLQVTYGEGTSSPRFDGTGDAVLTNPVFWIAVVAVIAVPWALIHTRAGLRARAAGDRPDALRAAGVSVLRTRVLAATVGGALAGLGGAQLSLSVDAFSADMAGGRGYMALAAVIIASWRPGRAAIACLVFALAEAINIQLQGHVPSVPRELAQLLPYLFTLAVLAGMGGGRRPPAALGRTDA
jgi:simple sugar transport system permease protein